MTVTQIATALRQACQELLNTHIPNPSWPPTQVGNFFPFFSSPHNSRGIENLLPGVGSKESCCIVNTKDPKGRVLAPRPVFYPVSQSFPPRAPVPLHPPAPARSVTLSPIPTFTHLPRGTYHIIYQLGINQSPHHTRVPENRDCLAICLPPHILHSQHSAGHTGAELRFTG